MLSKKAFLFFICLFLVAGISFAQQKKDSASSGCLVDMSYAPHLPGGDLAKLFGFTNDLQLAAYWKFSNNWMVGLQGAFLFGNTVKENVLDSIATHDGNIIGNDGNYASVRYFERGFDVQVTVGKLFPFSKRNLNSGLLCMFSAGYIRHHLRIENPNDWAPQIDSNYGNGYSRLTAGGCITEFIGYQYISRNHIVNFYAGLEFTQALTKSLVYDFDLMSMNNSIMHEYLFGIRAGWILPVLKRSANNIYYTY